MKNRTMCVIDGGGNQCTAGLQSDAVCSAARQAAQRIANDRGEPVWLCWESIDSEADDANDQFCGDGMRFDPQRAGPIVARCTRCSATYTRSEFEALPEVGTMPAADDGWMLVLANCSCRSTISMKVEATQ